MPSSTSLLVAFGLALFVMLAAGFSYITDNNLFYEYLYGSNSSAMLIETSRSTIAVFNETVFGNSILNKFLFFTFWMVIGLIVYVIVSGLVAGVNTAEQAFSESKFIHAEKLRMGSEFGLKVVLHIIAVGLLFLFTFIFIKILLPFGILCARIVAGDLKNSTNWLYGLLGFVVLATSIHLATILLRFLVLRPRIFGGYEDILQDEIEHKSS